MTDAEISKALRLLGLATGDLAALRSKDLSALKAKAKKGYKKAAAYLHPDVNGGDADKTADFVLVSTFIREFVGMQPPAISCKKITKRRFTVTLRTNPRKRSGVSHADG